MSRVELNTIQSKLKTAIQNHQMLVVKIKGDSQNLTLKKGLVELQEEIKRLSDEQKKIVVKLRESLVKSQNHSTVTSLVSTEATVTAIGQPHGQLVSFPTQGGSTILPVSMLTVPIAHIQQPAVNMYIHSASSVPLSQATSISLMPANIFTTGCNIMNSGISIGNNLLHNNIGVNNFDNGINSAHFTATPSVSTSTGLVLSNVNLNIDPIPGLNGCPLVSNSSIVAANMDNGSSLVINNNNSLLSSNNTSSDAKATISQLSQLPVSLNNTSCSVSSSIPSSSHAVSPGTTLPSAIQSLSSSGTGILGSVITQQPLVQPHLLQQQQQQILQMIQQQQQPQQRLASHLPIKVPQYTASHIRPGSNPTPLQNGNSAPAPGIVTTTHCMKVATSISVPAFSKSTAINDIKSVSTSASAKVASDSHKAHTKLCQVASRKVPPHQTFIKQATSSEEDEKNQFMEKLGLYTATALNEVLRRRNERKRRTTANPHYSIGFEISRRDGTGSIWNSGASKKQCVRGKNDSKSQQQSKKVVPRDNHDDFCAACGQGGQLLMCETCRLVYHLDCLNPPLTEAPKYAWSCPKCLVSGKGLTNLNKEIQKYINLKAAKVDRKKKIELINQELVCDKNYLETRLKQLNEKLKEESLSQSELSSQETKKKEELSKLSNFVRIMKDSSSIDNMATPQSSCV